MNEKIEKASIYPKVLIFPITYKCNARCSMCNIWRCDSSTEMSLNDIKAIFSDKILCDNLESVNLTGGEPMLREDILQIIEIIILHCRNVHTITLNTNGYFNEKYKDFFDGVQDIKKRVREFDFLVYFSIDGLYEKHDLIRGVKGFFEHLIKTLEEMNKIEQQYGIKYSLNFTISPYNYREMSIVANYAKNRKINLDFTFSMPSEVYFNNVFEKELWEYDNGALMEICETIDSLLNENVLTYSRAYYRNLIKMLKGGKRQIGCIFKEEGLFLKPDGNVYKCWADNKLLGNIYQEPISKIWSNCVVNYKVEELEEKCRNCYNNCYVSFQRNQSIKSLYNGIKK